MQFVPSVRFRSIIFLGVGLVLTACGDNAFQNSSYREGGVGDAFVVTTNQTSLPAAFRYARPDAVVRSLEVPVRFTPADNSATAADAQALFVRANVCLKAAEPALGGPDGEQLRLRLTDKTRGLHPIIVKVSGNVRGHARLWNKDWACPEIVHEVMHFVSLVDKYEEPQFPKRRYDCRALGPITSVMHNSWAAFYETSPTVVSANCHCVGKVGVEKTSCEAKLASLTGTETSCPAETLGREEKVAYSMIEPINAQAMLAARGTKGDGSVTVAGEVAGKRPNLLSPAEFRVIVYPNHPTKNAVYYACARNAYRTSSPLVVGSCGPVPAECLHEDWAVN